MTPEEIVKLSMAEITALPRTELEEAYRHWRDVLNKSRSGTEERRAANRYMEDLLAAMRRQEPIK